MVLKKQNKKNQVKSVQWVSPESCLDTCEGHHQVQEKGTMGEKN